MNNITSYAQNREDLYLLALVGGKKKGFYVDVGANHPIQDSVTRLFYEKGWRGINIEPNIKLFKDICYDRPNDINLNIGIAEKPGELVLNIYPTHDGFSTFSKEVHKSHSKVGIKFKQAKVKVETLDDVLSKYASNKVIDFLKIDVEGLEYSVVAGNDWEKYRPKVIVIEASDSQRCEDILFNKGYSNHFFDGLNNYYVADEHLKNTTIHNYSHRVLKPGYRTGLEKYLIEQVESLKAELKDVENQLELYNQKYDAKLTKRVNRLFRSKFRGAEE